MSYFSFLTKNVKKTTLTGLMVAVTLATPISHAVGLGDLFGNQSNKNSKILPVNQAFQVFPTQKGNEIHIRVEVADGYYAYQQKLKLNLPQGVTASPFKFSSEPNFVDDPDFGRVPVFEQTFTVTTTLSSDKAINTANATVKWQGCAKAGLCYPPEKTTFTIKDLSANVKNNSEKPTEKLTTKTSEKLTEKSEKTEQISQKSEIIASAVQPNKKENLPNTSASAPIASSANVAGVASTTATDTEISSVVASSTAPIVLANNTVNQENLNNQSGFSKQLTPQNQDIFGLQEHTGLAIVLLFLAGLGLAFTPCVLPMLPIVANIVARQHNPTAKKGLLLTGGYGLGVATSYGLIGALIAVFGQSLGVMNWLQNPVILLSFAGLFVLLGLYMLDMLPIHLPAKLSMKLQGLTQVGENKLGSVTGSFITGFFSALVVSPCVSAPLAGALAGVATVGNPIIGFLALFALGLGLSTPLILLGATQGNFMPKAGEWMNWVKTGFALMMFAVALLMVERVFISSFMLALWAVWFAVVAVWAYSWQGRGQLLSKAIAVILAMWTAILMIGVALGSQDSWQPLKGLTENPSQNMQQNQSVNQNIKQPIKITKLAELEPLLQQYPNVLVDVTAEWCIECRIMEKTLFANPPANLAKWQVVKLDVTENTPDSKAVYEQLQVFGPPVLLYFQNGKLAERQNGETKRADFESVLNKL
ncbi:protein-disulfide reductase DsbD domain-containing protein [Faucicola mancuniensis]|uniref:cytochrome c biogenesis protein CcdA n=1 Tax=Faucicola mancuniensis TaxID=1309795 RepID=UPI0028E4E746|nr:protein-disulfide reductase DsbD domain-containing protein [uncultured Moraxella sp.]